MVLDSKLAKQTLTVKKKTKKFRNDTLCSLGACAEKGRSGFAYPAYSLTIWYTVPRKHMRTAQSVRHKLIALSLECTWIGSKLPSFFPLYSEICTKEFEVQQSAAEWDSVTDAWLLPGQEYWTLASVSIWALIRWLPVPRQTTLPGEAAGRPEGLTTVLTVPSGGQLRHAQL